ncbi:MAG: DUF3006 domain-containing protein [Oscillospiraceae bacterium]|nr:DUF3006 domain-containing protein [Oscillospiraceae bacterium]MBR3962747.1 DUF3006 domain-containing protein [Oscillospiraceae bacterium]
MISLEVYQLDRIEEGIASVENSDGAMLFVSASRLPENAKDGDCLTFEKGRFYPAPAETKFRKKVIKDLLEGLVDKK